MRAIVAVLLAALLASPAQAKCPPLNYSQASLELRAETPLPIASPPVVDIDYSEFKPFCEREPRHPACSHTKGVKTPTLAEVTAIDSDLRSGFEYRADEVLYRTSDYWASSTICGDCEDYALALAKELSADGISGRDMALVLWAPVAYLAHATLFVKTSDTGWVEVGVSDRETPTKMNWGEGGRFWFLLLDGSRHWTKATKEVPAVFKQ